MDSSRRTGVWVTVALALVACTHPGTPVANARPVATAAPMVSPSATATPVVTPSSAAATAAPTRAVAVAVAPAPRAGIVAESVRGSTVVATLERRPPAGPGQGWVSVLVLDPSATRLVLHAGTNQPGGTGTWSNGPVLSSRDLTRTIAVFNGGFKTKDARGGWMSRGRTVVPLVRGAASVVTYADGTTDVGSWGAEVPTPGRTVVSVRQNLQLLIDGGRPQLTHPRDQAQLNAWWGHAFRDAALVSRSALGVTADGHLVYAAGTRITIGALDAALLAHGVVRAMELDINAPLVRGFLFAGPASIREGAGTVRGPLPVVVGQTQGRAYSTTSLTAPHCTYVTSCPRDFFAVELR